MRQSPSLLPLLGVLAIAAASCGDGPSEPVLGPAGLRLNVEVVQLPVGEDTVVTASLHDQNGGEILNPPAGFEVIWSTSNPEVATVANGVVRAVGEGLVRITARAGSLPEASVRVDVVEPEPIVVTAVDPPEGEQGRTLVVRILGNNFEEGDDATWERNGSTAQGIVVQETQFVSTTELRATISIAMEAELEEYDVAVSRKKKKGIGTEVLRGVAPAVFTVLEYTPHPLGWVARAMGDANHVTVGGMNDRGVIVGRDGCCAFTWTESKGMVPFGEPGTIAKGINNLGWIVGRRPGSGLSVPVPSVLKEGVWFDLVPASAADSYGAHRINDAGTVIGTVNRQGRELVPVVWLPIPGAGYGPPIVLPPPEGQAWHDGQLLDGVTGGINARGQIVGALHERTPSGVVTARAILWRPGPEGTYENPIVLGGDGARSVGINDHGWVVGSFKDGGGPPVPAVWLPQDYTRPIPLAEQSSMGGMAEGINNDLQVVGTRLGSELKPYPTSLGGDRQGTFWQLGPSGNTLFVIPLSPAPGYTESQAKVINADGWIAGTSGGGDRGHIIETTLWLPKR